MKRGEFIGTSAYVKNLDNSLRKLKNINETMEDIGENVPKAGGGGGGGMLAAGQRLQAVGSSFAGGNVVAGGITTLQQTSAAARDMASKSEGGGLMATLGKAGLIGMFTASLLAGARGINQLIYGDFERLAPQIFGYERRAGRQVNTSEYDAIKAYANEAVINRGDV